jgi:hypothetical protein
MITLEIKVLEERIKKMAEEMDESNLILNEAFESLIDEAKITDASGWPETYNIPERYLNLKKDLDEDKQLITDRIINGNWIQLNGTCAFTISRPDTKGKNEAINIRISYHSPEVVGGKDNCKCIDGCKCTDINFKIKPNVQYHFIDILSKDIENKVHENIRRRNKNKSKTEQDDIVKRCMIKKIHSDRIKTLGYQIIDLGSNDWRSIENEINRILGISINI